MTFICLICKEAVTSQSDYQITTLDESSENIIITTKCGHLYHKSCLGQFFSVQENDDEENGRRISPTLCPKCKRVVILENTIQIYPEDDEDAYYRLLTEKSNIFQENIKLRAQNEDLRSELQAFKETLNKKIEKNQHVSPPYNCDLKEGDTVICFTKDNTNEAAEGIVQSIGYYNFNSLHANISFENGNVSLVPISGLILRKDFYGEDVHTSTATCSNNNNGKQVSKEVPDNSVDSDFERRLLLFSTEYNKIRTTINRLREEVDAFASEQIDGVTFFIESQKAKAASLKRQLIAMDSSIQKLIMTQKDLADNKETETSGERTNATEGYNAAQIEIEKGKAIVILRDTLKLYNIALPQVQKIKSFIKAGFQWLDILETNVRTLLEAKITNQVNVEDQIICIDKEMQARQFLISTIKQAVEKFMVIPNSKLAQTDHNILVSTFSRFKAIEVEFQKGKDSLNNICQ